jgi:hypothetical protein
MNEQHSMRTQTNSLLYKIKPGHYLPSRLWSYLITFRLKAHPATLRDALTLASSVHGVKEHFINASAS